MRIIPVCRSKLAPHVEISGEFPQPHYKRGTTAQKAEIQWCSNGPTDTSSQAIAEAQ